MQVEDILEELREAVGNCSDEKLFSRLTDAVQLLANKGKYDLSTGYVDICAQSDGRTVTLPREIATPLAVNINGKPVFFRNKWFEFHLNGPGGNCPESPWSWDDRGETPTFMDIIRSARLIAVADLKTDLNTQVRVFGLDQDGRQIHTQEADGTWGDGFLVPINVYGDFPFGIVVPPDSRMFYRNFRSTPMTELISATPHELATGAGVTISVVVGSMPTPLLTTATYFVRKISDTEISLHALRSAALSGENAIVMTSAAVATVLAIKDRRPVAVQTQFLSSIPHRLATGTLIRLSGTPIATPFDAATDYYARVIDATNFTAHGTEDDAADNLNPIDATDSGTNVKVEASQSLFTETLLLFSVNHNFAQGDAVTISNETGVPPTPLIIGTTYFVRYISATQITLHNSLADATSGADPIALTSNGTGSTAVVKRIAASAVVGAVNNIQAPSHGLSLAGGDLVRFESTGSFPAPLDAVTVYRAEPPASADSFTVSDLVPVAINITTPGTGQLFLVISRVFTAGFTSRWVTDAMGLSTSDPVKIATTGTFPAAVPAINAATTYFLRKISDDLIEIYDTAFNAGNSPSTVGRITLTALGTGDLSLVFIRDVTPIPSSDLLRVDPALYLEDGAVARFETDGNLPPNLMILTDYKVSLEGGFLRVKTTLDVNVPIVSLGNGNHVMVITRNFSVDIPTTIEVTSNNYNNGNGVRFLTTGTLPSPLAVMTDYYLRRIDDDHVEVYDTQANALNTALTVGRITVTNTGTGAHRIAQVLAPIFVQRVDRVRKGLSKGFIRVYAWDLGRKDNLTLIGDYQPSEVDPAYRRIKVLNNCGSIRMRYQRRMFKITSVKDWIPIRSKMAVLTMTKAVDLWRSEFADRATVLADQAEKWLNEDQTMSDGPDAAMPQINKDIFTNPDDQYMT